MHGRELKSRNLLSYSRGRQATTRIIEQYHGQILVSLYEKKYNLACKLFEYAFEPALADNNAIFYSVGFHKFIASLLYLHFRAGACLAEEVFEDFERMMRELRDDSVKYLFGAVHLPEKANVVLNLVRQFCFHNRQAILEELEGLRGHGAGKWVLDLTDTSLFSHLATWGTKYHQLDVYCDRTQRLEGVGDLMKVMVGREERIYNEFIDREQPITFNLLKEVSLVKSSDYPGVQLADLAAGATVYALQNRDDREAQKWVEYFPGMLHRLSVLPDIKNVDTEEISVQRNIILLRELVYRSERGLSLTEGIGEFLAETTQYLVTRGPKSLLL